jgi:hypothetical protein
MIRGYRYRHEAEIARSMLEAAGIRCVLAGDDAGGMGPHIMSVNPIRLYVAAENLAEAEEILSEDVPTSEGEG